MVCFATVGIGAFSLTAAQEMSIGEERWSRIFEQCDSNGDGKLSVPELEKQGRRGNWILRADQDGDKLASWEEARSFLRGNLGAFKKGGAGQESVTVTEDLKGNASVTPKSIQAAANYSREQGGYSFLLMLDGRVVYEQYEKGRIQEDAHRLASGTKSFSGVILAAAVQDGLIAADELVAKTLTEWREDEKLSQITIRELLNLTSGIDPGRVGKVPSYRESVANEAVSAAGEKFRYGPNAFQVFGEVMRRKLEASSIISDPDPLAYLQGRVLKPIGMEVDSWRRDEDGMPHLPSGAFLTARNWARFGEFLRQGGAWEGKQLVDAATLKQCLEGSRANPVYGLTFWLLKAGRNENSSWGTGGYMAAGAGKQRLFVLPEKNAVVVRQGESTRFENERFLGLLFDVVGKDE